MSVPTGIGNYPPGVTDNDPHFDNWDEGPEEATTDAPLAADHGYCERCEGAKGTQLYLDRLLCDPCYDHETIIEPAEEPADFQRELDEEDDDGC